METTAQGLFNTALYGLRKQGRSSSEGGSCLYRGPDDMMCAVGQCLTDAEYSKELESKDIDQLMNRDLLPERFMPFHGLLSEMQMAHDMRLPTFKLSEASLEHQKIKYRNAIQDWESSMERIAYNHGLDYLPPELYDN